MSPTCAICLLLKPATSHGPIQRLPGKAGKKESCKAWVWESDLFSTEWQMGVLRVLRSSLFELLTLSILAMLLLPKAEDNHHIHSYLQVHIQNNAHRKSVSSSKILSLFLTSQKIEYLLMSKTQRNFPIEWNHKDKIKPIVQMIHVP